MYLGHASDLSSSGRWTGKLHLKYSIVQEMFLSQAVIDLALLERPWTQSWLDRLVMALNEWSGCSQPLLKIMRV